MRQYKDNCGDRALLSCKLAARCVGVSCDHRNMYKYITGNTSGQISSLTSTDNLSRELQLQLKTHSDVVAGVLVLLEVVGRTVAVSGQDNLTLTGQTSA